MRTESLREVKNHLSSVLEGLPRTGPVLITKRGRTCAVLLAADERTDLESLILSTSPRFWELIDRAALSKRWTRLEDLR
jgi:prevent-host-death family protein